MECSVNICYVHLSLPQGICKEVDYQVEEYEKWQRLLEIYNKVEARSSGTLKSGKKFRVCMEDMYRDS